MHACVVAYYISRRARARTHAGVFETRPFHKLIEDGILNNDNLSLHEQHYVCIITQKSMYSHFVEHLFLALGR